jgi:2-amino-4-hydroxy-6-hydroxymethyldihydropteridine diphosphokinase
VLSIGSNVGDRLDYLQSAVDALRAWLVAVSPVYETAPWGPVPQDDYLNAVVIATEPAASARVWLARGQAAEAAAVRQRDTRWGPRTLDVDLIVVDSVACSEDPELTLPHPRAAQRAFVLVPWVAVDPDARLGDKSVRDLLDRMPPAEIAGVRPRRDLVLR